MSGTPRFKVYDASGEYVGALVYTEDAAMLVGNAGDGAQVKDGAWNRRVIWTQGVDGDASMSFDDASEVMLTRIKAFADAWAKEVVKDVT